MNCVPALTERSRERVTAASAIAVLCICGALPVADAEETQYQVTFRSLVRELWDLSTLSEMLAPRNPKPRQVTRYSSPTANISPQTPSQSGAKTPWTSAGQPFQIYEWIQFREGDREKRPLMSKLQCTYSFLSHKELHRR